MATPTPTPVQRETRPPDLVEVFIILLISAALIIFIFWIATQYVGSDRFQNLPSFVTATFKSVWTAVATGATGIGLALVKAFSNHGKPQANYLMYIAICVACVLVPVGLLIASTTPSVKVQPPPPNVVIIDYSKTTPTDFDLENPTPGSPLMYSLKGSFVVRNGVLEGKLVSGKIQMPKAPPGVQVVSLTRISFRACYNDPTAPQLFRNIYPVVPKADDSLDASLALPPEAKLSLPTGGFTFSLPDPKHVSAAWICAALWLDTGGNLPAE